MYTQMHARHRFHPPPFPPPPHTLQYNLSLSHTHFCIAVLKLGRISLSLSLLLSFFLPLSFSVSFSLSLPLSLNDRALRPLCRYSAEIHGCPDVVTTIADVQNVYLDTTFNHEVQPRLCLFSHLLLSRARTFSLSHERVLSQSLSLSLSLPPPLSLSLSLPLPLSLCP